MKENTMSEAEVKDELLPCPFCGAQDIYAVVNKRVHCRQCDALGPSPVNSTNSVNACNSDALWNTRSRQSPVAAGPSDWVNCPICGEPDMRSTPDGDEGHRIIHCVNLNCRSNGGNMDAAASDDVVGALQEVFEREASKIYLVGGNPDPDFFGKQDGHYWHKPIRLAWECTLAVHAALRQQSPAPASEEATVVDLETHKELLMYQEMLEDARLHIDLIRQFMGVEYEPHQSVEERTLDAAEEAGKWAAIRRIARDATQHTINELNEARKINPAELNKPHSALPAVSPPSAVGELPPLPSAVAYSFYDTGLGEDGYGYPARCEKDSPLFSAEQMKEYGQLCQQGGGWRDIESAPRDGNWIVACGHNYGDPEQGVHYAVVRWEGGAWRDSDESGNGELLFLTDWLLELLPKPTKTGE